MGTYTHGILDHRDFILNFLKWINPEKAVRIPSDSLTVPGTDDALNRLAHQIEQYVAVDTILDNIV